ncbi:MAG: hypothetical protein ABL931_21110, partial [Usitatibacteraceae bacterium]
MPSIEITGRIKANIQCDDVMRESPNVDNSTLQRFRGTGTRIGCVHKFGDFDRHVSARHTLTHQELPLVSFDVFSARCLRPSIVDLPIDEFC